MIRQGLHAARDAVQARLRPDSLFWRRMLQAGVAYGPDAWVRYSPPLFGVLFGAALSRQRRVARETLRKLLGERPAAEEMRDLARVFTNFACCLTDSVLLGSERGYKPKVISGNDGADFKACVAEGRGVILATANTAGWDVAGPMLRMLQDTEVVVVMERESDVGAQRLHDEARRRAGVRVIHVGDDALAALPLLQHLRHKQGIVAMKFDRAGSKMRSRRVQFLGEPWRVPEGIFKLAAVSGAPILPVFTRRLGFLEYEFITEAPIRLPRRPDEDQLDAAAQRLADSLQTFARANPTHWFRFDERRAR